MGGQRLNILHHTTILLLAYSQNCLWYCRCSNAIQRGSHRCSKPDGGKADLDMESWLSPGFDSSKSPGLSGQFRVYITGAGLLVGPRGQRTCDGPMALKAEMQKNPIVLGMKRSAIRSNHYNRMYDD
jgi:hypothetical protein